MVDEDKKFCVVKFGGVGDIQPFLAVYRGEDYVLRVPVSDGKVLLTSFDFTEDRFDKPAIRSGAEGALLDAGYIVQ